MGEIDQPAVGTIAVIDCDVAILDAIRLVLEDRGWNVRTYATGEEFLADFDSYTPVCIILEPNLPGHSGADVVQSVAGRPGHIPIIGLTAWPDSLVTIAAANSGLQVMLTKPVTRDKLVHEVQAAIAIVIG